MSYKRNQEDIYYMAPLCRVRAVPKAGPVASLKVTPETQLWWYHVRAKPTRVTWPICAGLLSVHNEPAHSGSQEGAGMEEVLASVRGAELTSSPAAQNLPQGAR